MHINYKPADGWAADFIPFFWKGEFHLFYLKDFRNPSEFGEGTPWCHLVTADFIRYTDYGECLPRGALDEQDLYVFTGSVVYGEGQFHIFYTGHNPHFRQAGKPEQAILHAVSNDLVTWNKVLGEAFYAPIDAFEAHDWRDPYVFWNPEANEYWMLTTARQKDTGPSRRRGCTVLCTSQDLHQWVVKGPFYAPELYYAHECSDVFKMGDWWYLIFSEFSEACITRYRMARALSGPWLTPKVDTFDGRAYYAAKSASDAQQRFLFGWNPSREQDKDNGQWQWGGNLVVHALSQQPDGTLAVCIPASVSAHFGTELPVRFGKGFGEFSLTDHHLRLDGAASFRCVSAGKLPEACRSKLTLKYAPQTKGCGIMLRTSADFESGYYIRLEPQRSRLVFDSWPGRAICRLWWDSNGPLNRSRASPSI